MQIAVFGANGKVGTLIVELLLEQNYKVTAFIHGSNDIQYHPNLIFVRGDVHDKAAVRDALQGCDMVMSTLGSWGTKTKDILSSGMESIIPAMQAHGITRIITLTGAGAFVPGEKRSLLDRAGRLAMGVLAGKIIEDGERHIRLLQVSNLEWTVVRSPIMREKGATGYRLQEKPPLPWETINRNDVVAALASQISSREFIGSCPFIVRK